MRRLIFVKTILLTIFIIPTAVYAADDIATTKSGHKIPYSKMKLDDLGPKEIAYDITGMRKISLVPPPGVHPRMFHRPDDRL